MRIFGSMIAIFIWLTAAQAQENQAIEGVIGDQLQAFTARDVAGAWEYAAPNIQNMFGNSGNFGVMVERGYPMVWNNTEVRFLELADRAGAAIQRVLIRDENGLPHVLDYMMIETEKGWRIAGVTLVPAPDVGA